MLLVFSTFGKRREAENAAARLVKGMLAACVNLLQVKSTYSWKGRIVKSGEFLLIAKCPEKNYKKIESELRRLNSYALPEIVAVKVAKGLPEYLAWVEKR